MARRHHSLFPALLIGLALVGAACASDNESVIDDSLGATSTTADSAAEASPAEQDGATQDGAAELFPDVIDAEATRDADGTWTFAVTLSSPYDSPERYADAWRVRSANGIEYGVRVLTHDHANEQPFTRSQSGIRIPDDVETVIVEGRDQVSGWGGAALEVDLSES